MAVFVNINLLLFKTGTGSHYYYPLTLFLEIEIKVRVELSKKIFCIYKQNKNMQVLLFLLNATLQISSYCIRITELLYTEFYFKLTLALLYFYNELVHLSIWTVPLTVKTGAYQKDTD